MNRVCQITSIIGPNMTFLITYTFAIDNNYCHNSSQLSVGIGAYSRHRMDNFHTRYARDNIGNYINNFLAFTLIL